MTQTIHPTQTRNDGNPSLQLLRGAKWGHWTARTGGRRLQFPLPMGATQRLDDTMYDAFVLVHGRDGAVPSRGIQEIRDRRSRPWRGFAKRFFEMKAAGCDLEAVLRIIRALESWCSEVLYGRRPDRAA